jgi:hypothetical protein
MSRTFFIAAVGLFVVAAVLLLVGGVDKTVLGVTVLAGLACNSAGHVT